MSQLAFDDQQRLLQIAHHSIEQGLLYARHWRPSLDSETAALRAQGASFVTLEWQGKLRGCIGTLLARQALAWDVADNAHSAAFSDPRFGPLQRDEYAALQLSLSVLGAAQALAVRDEAELLARLQPGVDGVIIEQDGRRATFLPQVWAHFDNDARCFLRALRRKAGLVEVFDARAQYSAYPVQKIPS